MPIRTSLLAIFCIVFVSAAPPALAHKVIASVYASGDVIEGEIGFSNGDMAANTVVEVFDDAGTKLGETKTDADGFFVWQPTSAVAHVFRANLGAGHVAEVRLEQDELPSVINTVSAEGGNQGIGAQAASPAVAPAGLTNAQRDLIAEVVRQEVKSLRREIAEYKEKNDLQSILGGIGYILGLFGVGFYIAARRKMKAD